MADDVLNWAKSFAAEKPKTPSKADAFKRAADKLVVDPADLASIVSFESAGSFDPHKVGGDGNRYRGLIQFGPDEQKQYYKPGQTFEDQLEDGVVRYFQDRFKKAGRQTAGASLEDLYTTVIAGNPGANRNAKDSFGTSARSGAARIAKEHRPKVLQDIFGGQVPDVWSEVSAVLETPDDDVWAQVDKIVGKAPSPTNPVQAAPINKADLVVPETTATLVEQAGSALNGSSPKAAVLVNADQERAISPMVAKALTRVPLPDGRILFVNAAKARNLGITDYARDFAKLLGKVEDVGIETGQGQAVVTLGGDGTELNSSIVTSPQAAAKQASLDKAMFPNAAKQEILPAQEVVQRRYQQWLIARQLEDGRASRESFNVEQQAEADRVNDEAARNAPQQTATVRNNRKVQQNTASPRGQDASTQPEGFKTRFAFSGDAIKDKDEFASRAANALGADFKVVRDYITEQGLTSGQKESSQWKGRESNFVLDAQDVAAIRAMQSQFEKSARRKDTQTATAENQVKQYVEGGEVESVAQLLAAKDVGVKDIGGKPIDQLIQEERDAFQRFKDTLRDDPNEFNRILQSEEARKRLLAGESADKIVQERWAASRQAQTDAMKAEVAKEYGSFSKQESEKARIAEEYKTRPLAAPLEFAKGIVSTIPKGVSSIAKMADIIGEINPASVQNIAGYFSGKEFKADEGEAFKIGKKIDTALESLQNKDLKSYYQAGDSIGQVGVQIGLGILTGGTAAPLLYGSSMGAAGQYEDAGKLGAGKYTRQGAAVLGGLTAISDALPVAWALRPLQKGGIGKFLDGFLNQAYKSAVKEVGEKEAQNFVKELFKRTVDRAKTVATGAALETGQELFADKKITDLYASLTYDPKRKVFEINNDDLETAFFAAIGGAGGGGARIAIENKVAQNAPGLNLGTAIDKQGNEYDVVEDRGEQVLVKDAKGKISVRNKDRLTLKPLNETPTKVSPQPAQMDTPALAKDTPVESTDAVSVEPKRITPDDLNTVSEGTAFAKKGAAVKDSQPVKDQLTKGQRVKFFTDGQEREGTFDGDVIRDDKGQPWGIMGILNPRQGEEGWIQPIAAPASGAKPPVARVREEVPQGMVEEAPLKPATMTGAKNRIAELETEVQEERRKADTNDLTGLGSKNAWKKARPNIEANPEKAIISFDGNNIKSANDVTSHATVDEKVMARIGEATRKVFEKNGLPIRDAFTPSGDELYTAVPPAMAEKIRDEIEKEFGVVELVAERDYTNERTGETFKKGDIVPVTLSGEFGQTVAEAEKGLGKRKEASKAANPVKRASAVEASKSEDFRNALQSLLGKPNKGLAGMLYEGEKETFRTPKAFTYTTRGTNKQTVDVDVVGYKSKNGTRYVAMDGDLIVAGAFVNNDNVLTGIITEGGMTKVGIGTNLAKTIKQLNPAVRIEGVASKEGQRLIKRLEQPEKKSARQKLAEKAEQREADDFDKTLNKLRKGNFKTVSAKEINALSDKFGVRVLYGGLTRTGEVDRIETMADDVFDAINQLAPERLTEAERKASDQRIQDKIDDRAFQATHRLKIFNDYRKQFGENPTRFIKIDRIKGSPKLYVEIAPNNERGTYEEIDTPNHADVVKKLRQLAERDKQTLNPRSVEILQNDVENIANSDARYAVRLPKTTEKGETKQSPARERFEKKKAEAQTATDDLPSIRARVKALNDEFDALERKLGREKANLQRSRAKDKDERIAELDAQWKEAKDKKSAEIGELSVKAAKLQQAATADEIRAKKAEAEAKAVEPQKSAPKKAKGSKTILIPNRDRKKYAAAGLTEAEMQEQVGTAEFQKAEELSKTQKEDKNGFTPAQKAYLAKALEDYAAEYPADAPYAADSVDLVMKKSKIEEIPRGFKDKLPDGFRGSKRTAEIDPETIIVPDDGTFRVTDMQQANRLYQKITGKPLKGKPKEKIKPIPGYGRVSDSIPGQAKATNASRAKELISFAPDDYREASVNIPIDVIDEQYVAEIPFEPGRDTEWRRIDVRGKNGFTDGGIVLQSEKPFGIKAPIKEGGKPINFEIIIGDETELESVEPVRAVSWGNGREVGVEFSNGDIIQFKYYNAIRSRFPNATFKAKPGGVIIYDGKKIVGAAAPMRLERGPDEPLETPTDEPAKPTPQPTEKETSAQAKLTDLRKQLEATTHNPTVQDLKRRIAVQEKIVEYGLPFEIDPEADFPLEATGRAFQWNSMDPDRRARGVQRDYVEVIGETYKQLAPLAKTPEQQAILDAEILRFRDGYIAKERAVLAATAKTASSMVTGPARFPVEKNRRALDRERAVSDEALDWRKRAVDAIEKKLLDARTDEVKTDERWQELKAKIDRGFTANIAGVIERLADNGEVELVNRALDYMRSMAKPPFTQRHKIWGFGERAEKAAAKVKPTGSGVIAEFDGGTVVNNRDAERVQILFDERPSPETIRILKKSGWRWSPSNNAWQRQNTQNGLMNVGYVLKQAGFEVRKPDADDSLQMAAGGGITLDSLYDDNGAINYERAKDVAGRVERGELEIRRLDQGGEQGRIAGGQRNVEASIILAANERASEAAGSRTHPVKRQERILEEYAKKEGIWFDVKDFVREQQGYISKGVEAYVYRADDKSVHKLIDYKMIEKHLTPLDFIDNRISIFNHLFPETAYELVGFTRDADGNFRFVVKQPFIHDVVYTSPVERQTFMQKKGLLMRDKYGESFGNSLYKARDLHEKNALIGEDGTIFVIDSVTKMADESLYQPFEIAEPESFQMAAGDQTETAEFKNWFSGSRLNRGGSPIRMYHGTTSPNLESFDGRGKGIYGGGDYFVNNPETAGEFGMAEGGNVLPVYLAIKNPISPYTLDKIIEKYDHLDDMGQEYADAVRSEVEALGHDGIVTRTSIPGEIIAVAYRPSQVKSAIGNSGAFDPNEDSILKMAADDSSLQRFQDMAYAHTQTILEDAQSSVKEVDGQTTIELNEGAAELARRLWAGATGKPVGQFYGATHSAAQLRKFAREATKWAAKYEEMGYTKDQVKSLRRLANDFLTLANQAHGVTYVFDFALPHETHHKLVLDALNGKPFPKKALAELEALSIWKANPTIKTPDGKSKSFNSAYPNLSKAHKAIEMAAMLETGEISHSDKDAFLDIFARGILSVTTELDPVAFSRIVQYANTQTSDTGRDTERGDDSEADERSDEPAAAESEGDGQGTDTTRTRERDGGRTADEPKPEQPATEKERKVASFSRILGQEYFYDPQSHEETEVIAAQLISDKGTEAAIHDALHGTPSAEGMRVVHWELERLTGALDNAIREGNKAEIAAYAEAAADLSAKIIQRQVAGGQEVEIAKLLVPLSPEAALLTAQKMVEYSKGEGSTLTEDQTAAVVRLANQLRDARADIAKQDKKVKSLEKKIDDLKEERPATKTARMLKQYRQRKPVLLKELQDLFPDASVFNGESYSMVAWHGTPHRVDKFSIKKIGTGEGNQEFGYGLYFAEAEDVAEWYRQKLTADAVSLLVGGKEIEAATEAEKQLAGTLLKYKSASRYLGTNLPDSEIIASAKDSIKALIRAEERRVNGSDRVLDVLYAKRGVLKAWTKQGITFREDNAGAKYQVSIKPADREYLLWDKPLAEQSKQTQKGIRELADEYFGADLIDQEDADRWKDMTGGEFYKDLTESVGLPPEQVSSDLRGFGIRGIKYLDGSSRGKGEGNYNYVIFDDQDVEILESFQMAASGLTDEQYAKLVEYAGGEILENKPYKTLLSELDQFTGDRELSKEIHAESVDSLRSERPGMTEEAKEILKTRNEHYREADKILKPKGQNQNVKPKIDKNFKKLNDQNVRELSRLAQRVWAKTGDPLLTLAVERLTADPRSINDVIKDIQSANPGMSIADATSFARKAKQMATETKREMDEERDKLRGILPEQRKALAEARVAKQKATMKLNKFLANLADDSNAIKRFNNDLRAKFVSNWGTQAFNVIQSMTVTNPTEAMLDLFTVALKATGLNIGSTPDINAKDILLPMSYIFANNRQMAEFALSEFPDQFFQVHSGLLGDIDIEPVNLAENKTNAISKTAHKWFDWNQRVNNKLAQITGAKLQEMHFRNAMVAGTFDQIIRRKSNGAETLESAIENGTLKKYITEEDANFAAHKALRVTFAAQIDDKMGKAMKRVYDKLDSFLPIFLNPIVYARFTYTTTKVMVANPILFGALDAKALGGPGYDTRSLASGVLGWAGIATAAALMANFGGDDDEWYTLKFGDTYFDIRRTFPLSTYFYMAHLIRSTAEGKPAPTAKELLEGFASLETDYFTYGAGMEMYGTVRDKLAGTKEWSDVGASGARLAGNFFAGYLRFFKPMRDVLSQFDQEENKLRFYDDSGQDKFVQEISKSLPLVARAYGAETQKDAKGKDIGMPFPAGRLVGINVVHPSFLKPEQSTATKWAMKLFPFAGAGGSMSAEDRKAWQMRRTIKNAVRRGTPQSEIQERLQSYRKEFGEKSFGRLKDELSMSELAAKIKYDFGASQEKEVKALRKIWQYATDAEKTDLRKILREKKNRTVEFNREFGL